MSPQVNHRFTALRWAFAALLVCLASYVLLLGSLRHERLNMDIGPGDADYVQGLSDYWRYDASAPGGRWEGALGFNFRSRFRDREASCSPSHNPLLKRSFSRSNWTTGRPAR